MMTVQAALQSDQSIGGLQTSNVNFERWIKHGLTAEELGNSSNLSGEGPSQGASCPYCTQTSLPAACATPSFHYLLLNVCLVSTTALPEAVTAHNRPARVGAKYEAQ